MLLEEDDPDVVPPVEPIQLRPREFVPSLRTSTCSPLKLFQKSVAPTPCRPPPILPRGAAALRVEMALAAVNRLKPFPNAWQPVLYAALAKSDEFLKGGFYKI